VLPKAREVVQSLRAAGVRVHLDDRDTQQPGFKYADWEMRGVPLRLEIGPKDVEKDQCVLVRRDTREKAFVPLASVAEQARGLLTSIQDGLLDRARRFVADNTTRVSTYDEFKRVMAEKRGFLVTGWCRSAECEAKIKEETKATVRVIPIEGTPAPGPCVRCGQPCSSEVYFAQAY
jgi:prolyl-tRNA synthetase